MKFLDALYAINRLTSEDWGEDGIPESDIPRLRSTFTNWNQQLSGDGQE